MLLGRMRFQMWVTIRVVRTDIFRVLDEVRVALVFEHFSERWVGALHDDGSIQVRLWLPFWELVLSVTCEFLAIPSHTMQRTKFAKGFELGVLRGMVT